MIRLPRYFEFLNCALEIGYLIGWNYWGVTLCWDRVEDPQLGDIKFRHGLTLLIRSREMEEDRNWFIRWWPIAWFTPQEWLGETTPCFNSWDWTGRTECIRRIDWPRVVRW